jgi:hypothetical protein
MNNVRWFAAIVFLSFFPRPSISLAAPQDVQMKKMEERLQKRQDARLVRLSTLLNLTDAQKKAVKAALDSETDKVKTLNAEFVVKRKTLSDQTIARINSALSPAQKKKFTEIRGGPAARRAEPAPAPK